MIALSLQQQQGQDPSALSDLELARQLQQEEYQQQQQQRQQVPVQVPGCTLPGPQCGARVLLTPPALPNCPLPGGGGVPLE